MLTQLFIRNIAVISEANVQFSEGLNVFTGETGAGKTILISAIDAVLGERTSKEMIRNGEDKALVTAMFEDVSPRALSALEELGYSDDEGNILISREILSSGKSICKINGIPATASILKTIASLLVNIHGQRDSAQLLAGDKHLKLIDIYGETEAEKNFYREAYDAMCDIQGSLDALEMDDAQKAQRIDMLSFQIEEIESAELEDVDEEERLVAQKKLIKNSEKIRNALSDAYLALNGSTESSGINSLMTDLANNAAQTSEFIADVVPMANRIEEMTYELAEFTHDIRNTLDEFEFDSDELDNIESRLDTIYKLRRKYGENIAEIISFCDKAKNELENITCSEQKIKKLTENLNSATKEAQKRAEALSKKRAKTAQKLTKFVEEELAFLDMPSVKISVKHETRLFSHNGVDDMEFFIVTNVGETPKPLSKIASGGELSRIMLSIKNVLAEKDDITTLVFDEVDSGVSGRAAQKIGKKLSQVSHSRQVICVTHLAQVAAFADNHLYIHKEVDEGRTYTKISMLDESAITKELARIISGDNITDAALENAKEMRELAKKDK